MYSITAKGRRALADWVPTPGDGPVLEFEQLVKIFFAEHGSKADLLATLKTVEDWLGERARQSAGISQAYLAGEGQFPERLPWLILAGKFLEDFDVMVENWVRWATAVVERWPDDIRAATPDIATLNAMSRRNDERLSRNS
jgi:hypothetical protein